jgi:hypothetical protein
METLNKVMEMFWLALGTVLVIVFGFMTFDKGFDWSYPLINALPFGMYFARRIMRKKMEKIDK